MMVENRSVPHEIAEKLVTIQQYVRFGWYSKHMPHFLTSIYDYASIVINMPKYKTVSKANLKPKLLEYLRQVEETKQPLVITHFGKPSLKIVPVLDEEEETRKILAASITKYERPLDPVAVEDWEVLKD